MTSKERLEQYIKEDEIYNEYLDNHKSYVSDFDRFCIEHCQDIKNILEENVELKKQLEVEKKHYNNLLKNFKISKDDYIELYDKKENQQKEFINFIEKEKDRLASERSNMYEDSLGKIQLVNEDIFNEVNKVLSKYKEIIEGVEDEDNL